MTSDEIIHIVVAPPDVLDEDLIKRVAAIVNKDLYETRLILTGKVPRIVAHYRNIQTAGAIVHNLKELGLVVFSCSDSELRKSSLYFRANTIELGQQEVSFRNKKGQQSGVTSKNVFLILEGHKLNYSGSEETITKVKFNLPVTALTGLPIFKKVKEKTGKQSTQMEGFLRLYDGKSSCPLVEILQHDFDYSFLENQMTSFPDANFRSAVTKIKGMFPNAIFNDRLTQPVSSPMPLTSPEEALEINCKLICLYYRTV